jgi:hypothetical protein
VEELSPVGLLSSFFASGLCFGSVKLGKVFGEQIKRFDENNKGRDGNRPQKIRMAAFLAREVQQISCGSDD